MQCPKCEQEMKDKSYMYYGLGSWDMDYPDTLHEEYCCKDCHIKFINGEWDIPKKFERPTKKQINTIKFIQSRLPETEDFEPLLKSQAWKFISYYFEQAKLIKLTPQSQEYDNWDYESALPEQW